MQQCSKRVILLWSDQRAHLVSSSDFTRYGSITSTRVPVQETHAIPMPLALPLFSSQLVLISISDQCTRARQNSSAPSTSSSDHPSRVYGCLLGEQSGRNVDISNSFELRVASHSIDLEFLQKRADQCEEGWRGVRV